MKTSLLSITVLASMAGLHAEAMSTVIGKTCGPVSTMPDIVTRSPVPVKSCSGGNLVYSGNSTGIRYPTGSGGIPIGSGYPTGISSYPTGGGGNPIGNGGNPMGNGPTGNPMGNGGNPMGNGGNPMGNGGNPMGNGGNPMGNGNPNGNGPTGNAGGPTGGLPVTAAANSKGHAAGSGVVALAMAVVAMM